MQTASFSKSWTDFLSANFVAVLAGYRGVARSIGLMLLYILSL